MAELVPPPNCRMVTGEGVTFVRARLWCSAMRKIGPCIAIVALVVIASSPPAPAAVLGIRIGPFHLGFGSHGDRHHRHRSAPGPAQDMSSALLYPQLALPTVYAFVFSSGDGSSWPFDYRPIFLTGFAKLGTQPNAELCQQPTEPAAKIAERIRGTLELQPLPMQRLRDLEHALDAATASLAQACPHEIPTKPRARLELMESQLGKITAALDMVREPLLTFQQSLNDEQRTRLADMITAGASSQANLGCGSTARVVDWSIEQIDRAVQPTDAQHEALGDVKHAFAAAASTLAAHCLAGLPAAPPSRLEEIAANLAVTQQAVASIRVALMDFQAQLSDKQNARFDAINFTVH